MTSTKLVIAISDRSHFTDVFLLLSVFAIERRRIGRCMRCYARNFTIFFPDSTQLANRKKKSNDQIKFCKLNFPKNIS